MTIQDRAEADRLVAEALERWANGGSLRSYSHHRGSSGEHAVMLYDYAPGITWEGGDTGITLALAAGAALVQWAKEVRDAIHAE